MNILKRIALQLPVNSYLRVMENNEPSHQIQIEIASLDKGFAAIGGCNIEATDQEFVERVTDVILQYNRTVPL